MADIVDELRDLHKQATIERSHYYVGSCCQRAASEIVRLREPWRAVDEQDWQYLLSMIPDGGRGRFWKAVLGEARAALAGSA